MAVGRADETSGDLGDRVGAAGLGDEGLGLALLLVLRLEGLAVALQPLEGPHRLLPQPRLVKGTGSSGRRGGGRTPKSTQNQPTNLVRLGRRRQRFCKATPPPGEGRARMMENSLMGGY